MLSSQEKELFDAVVLTRSRRSLRFCPSCAVDINAKNEYRWTRCTGGGQ
jgi:NADH pyrophosphatase NudC (nudix superfamily)